MLTTILDLLTGQLGAGIAGALLAVAGFFGYRTLDRARVRKEVLAEQRARDAARVGEQAAKRVAVDDAQRLGGPDAMRDRLRRAARERAQLRRLARGDPR